MTHAPVSPEDHDVQYWRHRLLCATSITGKLHCGRQLVAARRRRGDFGWMEEVKREKLDKAGERHD